MYQWGQLDLDAVINWASDKYDKIFLLGHSVAGQVFPYAENRNRISAAYFIASQSAYFGYWRGFEKIKTLLFWYLILPLATKFYGFLPGWTMGGNVSLPKGVAKEWRKWGISKSGFLKSDPKARDKFNDLHIPIHFICLADDSLFGPPEAVQALMHRYGNSKTSFQFIKPSDLKVKSIGHFGFFKSKHQEKLWSMPVMYFTQFVKNFNQG
jgi:predicted alpha/beta hydrolase